MRNVLFYAVSFVAAPAIFTVLAKKSPERRYFRSLAVIAALLTAVASLALRHAPRDFLPAPWGGVVIVTAYWLAWIIVLAMCFLALRRALGETRGLNWGFAAGAVATTLPWFGLYAAQAMAK